MQIEGILDPGQRVDVIRRRVAFEDDPAKFCSDWEPEQEKLRQRIIAAKKMLPGVQVPDKMLYLIAEIAIEMGVDGHRADLIMMKAAKTMAALQGREEVGEEDIRTTADLALVHRMRRKPFQDLDLDQQKLEDIMGGPSHRHLHAHAHKHEW